MSTAAPIFVSGCAAGLTTEAIADLRRRAWLQIDHGRRQHVQIRSSQLLDLLAIAEKVPTLLEAAQAAWNCIGELPPTQARVEVAQLLQAAIEKALGEQP